MKRSPVKKKRTGKPRRGPLRDDQYLDWIRQQRCIVPGCRQQYQTEAAHVGLRGFGQKCSDHETLPLCVEHHREGPSAHHVLGKRFWEVHGIDMQTAVEEQRALYVLDLVCSSTRETKGDYA